MQRLILTSGGSPTQKKADFIDDDNNNDWYESSSDGLSLNFTPVGGIVVTNRPGRVGAITDKCNTAKYCNIEIHLLNLQRLFLSEYHMFRVVRHTFLGR